MYFIFILLYFQVLSYHAKSYINKYFSKTSVHSQSYNQCRFTFLLYLPLWNRLKINEINPHTGSIGQMKCLFERSHADRYKFATKRHVAVSIPMPFFELDEKWRRNWGHNVHHAVSTMYIKVYVNFPKSFYHYSLADEVLFLTNKELFNKLSEHQGNACLHC